MSMLGKKIEKKLKSISGVSFVEMLCVVLLLLLVSGVMTTAVSVGVRQYQKSMRNSEAKILSSTLMTVMSNELAYTTDIKIDADRKVTKFQSQSYTIEGSLSTWMTDNSGRNGYGQILLGNMVDTSEYKNVLGKAAYTNGLLAKVESITYDNVTHCFRVELSIGYQGEEYMSQTFDVMSVNQIEAEPE